MKYKAMGILKYKYRTLKELLVSHKKIKRSSRLRQDQLVVMKDSHSNDAIIGQGKFDVFKADVFVTKWAGIS